MEFQTDSNNIVSVLAEVRRRSRDLAPIVRSELSTLLGKAELSRLHRFADLASEGRLCDGIGREMIYSVIAVCSLAIEEGTHTEIEWCEVRYIDGAPEFEPRAIEVLSEGARTLLSIRSELARILDLVGRAEDLIASEKYYAVLRN